MSELVAIDLPRRAPARVLALGAFLKNTACLLDGDSASLSAVHGDLGTPAACTALEASARMLLDRAHGPIDAVAHDLHPDFFSSRFAVALAQQLGVPALAVQHHHAHVAVVQAEQGLSGPLLGLALDGVGLGSDGGAWGGELLRVDGARWQRLAHLPALALPGGDVAAREPWRMAAAALHAFGRTDAIEPRFAPVVGPQAAQLVRRMLERGLNCPATTAAGRWFDAAAGWLALSVTQTVEAEAAIALERAATAWLADHPDEQAPPGATLALADWLPAVLDDADVGRAAARFHLGLAAALADAAAHAAQMHAAQMHDVQMHDVQMHDVQMHDVQMHDVQMHDVQMHDVQMHDVPVQGATQVALAGGCFFNRLLAERMSALLRERGLRALLPRSLGCGDAGLALGQAWVAAHALECGLSDVGADGRVAALTQS